MKAHALKTWPEPFEAVRTGVKTYEIRVDDRGFDVGDLVLLYEWLPLEQRATGRRIAVRIVHLSKGWGLSGDLCVFGFVVGAGS